MEEKKLITIDDVTAQLHQVFDKFNQTFFNNELPQTALTIQSTKHRKRTMGWCTKNPVWSFENGENSLYEINLSAEFLDQGFFETMDTLLHEMVHLFNQVKNIQDVSRKGQYHNKHFKNKVLELGYEYDSDKPDKYVGWGYARIGSELTNRIDNLDIDKEVFRLARHGSQYLSLVAEGKGLGEAKEQAQAMENTVKNASGSIKYVCPGCRLIIRSYKSGIDINCNECDCKFEEE